jgi:hypothetical protein
MLRLNASCIAGTKAEIEKVKPYFKFKGPGWYINKGFTHLVIPRDNKGDIVLKNCWKQKWTKTQVFYVYTWEYAVSDLFNAIVNAPIREDTRD